jgi:hypothetical protein
MSFFSNFFRSSAPASLPPGWQEITVDGKKMYMNITTNKISSTPPPPPPSAKLPPDWKKITNHDGTTYYAGPLTVIGETTTYRQDEFPTWEYRPKAFRISSNWKLFSSNAKTNLYQHITTKEITQNYPLAYGDDLETILADESAKVANEPDSWEKSMRNHRGGLKNKSKRKQRKRKQSKRK